jgi:hypothetical protein
MWRGSLRRCKLFPTPSLFVLAVGLLLTAMPTSYAAAFTPKIVGQISYAFSAKASHGYRVNVSNDMHHSVTLTAERRSASTSYTVKGSAAVHAINATFPGRGQISVKFQSTGAKKLTAWRPTACKVTEPGIFNGTIRFAGERGYTKIETSRVRGLIFWIETQPPNSPCFNAGNQVPLPIVGLVRYTTLRAEPGSVRFEAIRASRQPVLTFRATNSTRTRGTEIYRSTSVSEHGLFEFDNMLTTATVAPGPPFIGSADFNRPLGFSPTFIGSLKAPLPGLGIVPLTGTGVEVSLEKYAVGY